MTVMPFKEGSPQLLRLHMAPWFSAGKRSFRPKPNRRVTERGLVLGWLNGYSIPTKGYEPMTRGTRSWRVSRHRRVQEEGRHLTRFSPTTSWPPDACTKHSKSGGGQRSRTTRHQTPTSGASRQAVGYGPERRLGVGPPSGGVGGRMRSSLRVGSTCLRRQLLD